MNGSSGTSSAKEIFCFFHVGGKFERNGEGVNKYNGGSVKVRTIPDGIKYEDLRVIISRWIGNESMSCDIKYTVGYDEKTLIDLDTDGDIRNLFLYNDSSAHLYVGAKVKDGEGQAMDDTEIVLTQSQRTNASMIDFDNHFATVDHENGYEWLPCEDRSRHDLTICTGGETSDATNMEMRHLKWFGIFSGVGQHFAHADAFRQAVYKFSLAHNFVHKYVRNSKEKISVKCKAGGCPWKICASAMGQNCTMLRVTKFMNEHVHSAQDNLGVMRSGRASLTASIIIDEVRNHVEKRPSEIRKTLQMEYGLNLTYKQAYRAKEKAMEDIHGRPEQSYMLIPWIC